MGITRNMKWQLTIGSYKFGLSDDENNSNVEINSRGVLFKSNRSKSVLPKKLIKHFEIEKNHLLIHIAENKSWNENIKKKYPVRYFLGLIKPYMESVKLIRMNEDNENLLKPLIEQMGYLVN